jgi:hypothetical protein
MGLRGFTRAHPHAAHGVPGSASEASFDVTQPSFLMKRMREGDTTKRETESQTSASRRARLTKNHLPPANSGATTPLTNDVRL